MKKQRKHYTPEEKVAILRRLKESRTMKAVVAVVLFSIIVALGLRADQKKEEEPKPAQSIAELQQQVEKILKDTHTPGVSVAIIHRDGPEWVAGLGKADVATDRGATADTLFRIGSTSKAFAALSILMLVDQGKLSLNDPVHKLVPEVWFENPWEATDPVRIVHLLEHTTGWDDMHLREYTKDWPGTMGLREALDYDHHSRVSRWRPGTRMSYCNSGPPVAAYIVEKRRSPWLVSAERKLQTVHHQPPVSRVLRRHRPCPYGSISKAKLR